MGNIARAGGRPGSAHLQSRARDILKKRDKPLQAEMSHQSQTRYQERSNRGQAEMNHQPQTRQQERSYRGKPPAGFVFVPLGTPDLAELCKKMSEDEDQEVQVVNAPASGNPRARISDLIRRIGYHFRDHIVEAACSELNYTILEGEFVKEDTLLKRHTDNKVAKIMERYGMHQEVESEETHERVSAVVREIFPAIPEEDLGEIVKHAWEAGTDRVGNGSIDLPSKVQLAVTARIRHKYTDYDILLRTFRWDRCRVLVQDEVIKKIIEWRGEVDVDDTTLQGIVRDTILIDEESANEGHTHRRRTIDTDTETGNVSDMGQRVTPPSARNGRKRKSDQLQRSHLEAERPQKRSFAERNDRAKAMIQAVRAQPQMPAMQPQPRQPERIVRTWVDADRNGAAPEEIVINGVRMIRAPSGGNPAQAAPVNQLRSSGFYAAPSYGAPVPQQVPNQAYRVVARPVHGSPAAVQHIPYAPPQATQYGQYQYPR